MSKTTNKFSADVRERAGRILLEHQGEYSPRWAAITSISEKIGCLGHTLNEWLKKVAVDSGKRAGVPTESETRRPYGAWPSTEQIA